METIDCVICGNKEYRKLFDAIDPNASSHESFQVVTCDFCDLTYVSPRPDKEEIASYYSQEYYGEKNIRFNPVVEFFIKLFRGGRARKILKHKKGGSLLDIGCGRGHMLSILRNKGWDVLGVELSESSSSFAREVLKLDVVDKSVEDIDFGSKQFDCITMWHVFEHLSNPSATLQKMKSILKDDGLVVISVPNFASLQSRISKEKWFHLDLPRHLFHFTPESMDKILNRNGFEVFKRNYVSMEYSYFGMIQSLYNTLGLKTNMLYNLIRKKSAKLGVLSGYSPKDMFLLFILAPIVMPVGILLCFFVDFTKLGGNLEIYARKKY